MNKITQKLDDGRTGVLFQIDKQRVFSEDFKAIIRSMMLGHMMSAFQPEDEGEAIKEHGDAAMERITRDVIEIVLEALPMFMSSCVESLKDSETYRREMSDLLGCAPEDVPTDEED